MPLIQLHSDDIEMFYETPEMKPNLVASSNNIRLIINPDSSEGWKCLIFFLKSVMGFVFDFLFVTVQGVTK